MGEWFDKVTLGDALDQTASRLGDYTAYRYAGQGVTFRLLQEAVNQAARGLLQCGVRAGDKVALWLTNRPEWLHIAYAVAKIGAVLVPINTRFRTQDLAYVLRQSDSSTLIIADRSGPVHYLEMVQQVIPELATTTTPDHLQTPAFPDLRRVIRISAQAVPGTLRWSDVLGAAQATPYAMLQARQQAVHPDDIVLMMYTSGTTGFPKGVLHCHNILRNAMDLANRMAIGPRDVLLMYLPLFHAFGFYQGFLVSTVSGACQVLMEQFDPGEALRLIAREQVTRLYGFDTHFQDLMNHPACPNTDRSSLRLGLLAAGLASTEPIARRAQQQLCPTISGWGMTESGACAALGTLFDSQDDRCCASGIPMPGYTLKIVDPASGRTLPPEVPGELYCRSYQITPGYYNKPEETAKAIDAEGWLHTGDMATLRQDGTLRFLGRYKEMLKVGGENVDPVEVEAVLLQHPAVQQVKVVGVPDARLQEVACACVILEPGAEATAAALLEFYRGKVASFKIPRHVLFLQEYPMTSSGKVQKLTLRSQSIQALGLQD